MKPLLILLLLSLSLASAQSLKEGDAAFLPTLNDSYDSAVNLAEVVASGHWLVLWFYPKAMTPGCSLQAKRYSDLQVELEAAKILAFGVSADDAEAQCNFIEALKLSGQMLPDRNHSLAKAYGVQGITYSRDTVLINPAGMVEKIWRQVEPIDDADRVLEYVLNSQ
jgi:thioredoxin-dependent peroxiredoxin